MRQAGGFHPGEYKNHCAWGGHPNPSARWMLPNHKPIVDPTFIVADLAQHLSETATLLMDVIETLPNADAWFEALPVPPLLIAHWRQHDPLAARIKIPDSPGELDAP